MKCFLSLSIKCLCLSSQSEASREEIQRMEDEHVGILSLEDAVSRRTLFMKSGKMIIFIILIIIIIDFIITIIFIVVMLF